MAAASGSSVPWGAATPTLSRETSLIDLSWTDGSDETIESSYVKPCTQCCRDNTGGIWRYVT